MFPTFPKILLVGDSLTEGAFGPSGYGTAMVEDYAGKCDVLNRGFGSYSTKSFMRMIEGDAVIDSARNNEFRLVVINLGTNDCHSGPQHVPIQEFAANLERLIQYFKERCSSIIVFTPTIVDVVQGEAFFRAMGIKSTDRVHTLAEHRAYADAALQAATSCGVVGVDLYSYFNCRLAETGRASSDLFSDGLHLSPLGYSAISRKLRETIDTEFPHLSPPIFPLSFPWASPKESALPEIRAILETQGWQGSDDEALSKIEVHMQDRARASRAAQLISGDGLCRLQMGHSGG